MVINVTILCRICNTSILLYSIEDFFFEIQVGLACVQIAKSRGLHVLGTAGSEAGIDLILRNGCDAAFSHREDGYAAKIMVP